MAFLSSFDISASALSAQRVRMDIAAENIANIDSTRTEGGGAYRRKDVLFESFGAGSFKEALRNASMGKGFAGRNAGVRVAGIIEDDREMKQVYNPGHPDADENGYVLYPNVNIVTEMTNIIDASRAYEANATAFSASKAMAVKGLEMGQ